MNAETIELSDDWDQEDPIGFAVFCYDPSIAEYELFADRGSAKRFALQQERKAREEGEPRDWKVYPLFASHPLD